MREQPSHALFPLAQLTGICINIPFLIHNGISMIYLEAEIKVDRKKIPIRDPIEFVGGL